MMRINVTASGHHAVDDWVMTVAEEHAMDNGLVLGRYLGLVDERDSTGFYYHTFEARPDWDREWNV